jgi:head-tail adaptor
MPVNLQAGQLRNRVRFETRGAPVSDGAGNQVAEWGTRCERPAKVTPVGGNSESVVQGRLTGVPIASIIVRFDALTRAITTDDRATDIASGAIYNIRSVEDIDGDRRWLSITAQRSVAT